MPTVVEDLLAQTQPTEALAALQNEVRAKPGDVKLRVLLFQLLSVLGQWQRAAQQLDVCAQLDAATLAMVNTYREALKCELVREAAFNGKTTPMVLGRPTEWVALLIQALQDQAAGRAASAQALRERALELAEPVAGTLNGAQPFEWICDADSRLGPVLEVIVNGRYCWVPFNALAKIDIEAPQDLRDLVWAPAHLEFPNGGDAVALIPTRYVGVGAHTDERLLMARLTEWEALAGEHYAGHGQRVLASDAGDFALLELRSIELRNVGPQGIEQRDGASAA